MRRYIATPVPPPPAYAEPGCRQRCAPDDPDWPPQFHTDNSWPAAGLAYATCYPPNPSRPRLLRQCTRRSPRDGPGRRVKCITRSIAETIEADLGNVGLLRPDSPITAPMQDVDGLLAELQVNAHRGTRLPG